MTERLFLGIPFPAATAAALSRQLRQRFPRGLPGRPVPPENWHITLRFLGEVEPEARDRLLLALDPEGLGRPFELVLDRLGAFPSDSRARVLWLGSQDRDSPILELAANVEQRVRQAGFPAEERPFSPHVTLARLREPENLRHAIGGGDGPRLTLSVTEIALFRSHLGGPAARYEVVRWLPL